MSKKDELERKRLEMPTVGDNLENVGVGDLDRAEISDEDRKKYDSIFEKSKWNKTKEFFKNLWNGNNKVGQYLGLGLDAGETFLPSWIGRIRDIIQSKTQPKPDSNMNWVINRLQERSTWRGIITALTAIGAGVSPDQAQAIVGLGVSLFVAIEVFMKEPKSKDAK